MKILVTGASGFIGSYIVEEALRQGMETWAAVRPTSSRKYLQDERIHFINLNLSSEEELEKELAPHEFDYIVHAAGATKCLHAEDFYKAVSYTHLTLPTITVRCRSRWSPYH